MEKLQMMSTDLTQSNIEKIAELFPNVITETTGEDGKLKKAVDFELLKQELSHEMVDGNKERYQLTWPGKKEAMLHANQPIDKTLRPVKEDSVDWEQTENLYIEGDNLEVLKLLQESYLNSIKCIYIDPPYNTGHDFIYKDDFRQDKDEYLEESGQIDEEGNRLFQNTESNGRFHSDWLTMMYPRLKLARNLLKDDGVIFVSADDNEVKNVKTMCDEIFGEKNFEGHIHWRRRHNQPNDKTKMIGLVAEHIIAYAKNKMILKKSGVGKIDLTGSFSNPDNDPRGDWASKPWKVGTDQGGSRYSIITPTGKVLDEEWMGDEDTYKKLLLDNRIIFPKKGDGMPRKKYFRFEREEEGQCATNWWPHDEFGHNQGANDTMTELFGVKNIFSNPKPIQLIRGLLQISNSKYCDIILDFFSGSSTTAHSLMQLNAEDGERRRYIMVQLPEKLDKNDKDQMVAYELLESIRKPTNICEIGKERIRRAAKKIKEETGADIDYGFRVFKVDSSNMKDVYYNPNEIKQDLLAGMESNIKDDRTGEDLIAQVMLDWGLQLSLPMEKKNMFGKEVYFVAGNSLIACFDENVSEELVKEIAKENPLKVVFRDSSFASDSDRINVEEIFKMYSPTTSVKVI
jgi:adenine-specific DNA-methyltransferase